MKFVRTSVHSLRLICFLLALFTAARPPIAAQAETGDLFATLSRGTLSVTIPYRAARQGSGKLTVELLDPEGQVLAHNERYLDVAAGDGQWWMDLTPATPLPLEDLIWQRLRYRFQYGGEATAALQDTASISEVLRRPVVRILGQSSYLAGGEAAVRLLVTDPAHQPVPGSVRIELLPADDPGPTHLLFTARLNSRATTDVHFRFPAGLIGAYRLHYLVDTPMGSVEDTQPIHLEDKASILLTTDKPLYQPGQTIHVRALALAREDHHATAGDALTFELEDPRGNRVFKKITATDAFGIASAEFSLADEVNLGAYHLRALMGDAAAPTNTAELALNVERYVLPKFKVAVDFAMKGDKPRKDYRPGDHVLGTIQANYFFGKPVNDAEITLKASSVDVTVFDIASLSGKTDKDGAYGFDLKLPDYYFAGRPLSQGSARVLLEATVKDSAGHSETRGEPITVSNSALLITAVPESGKLVPGLDNQVYILTAYPDGTPAATTLNIHLPPGSRLVGETDQQLTTGADGVAVLHVTPGPRLDSVAIDADDHRGSRASLSVPLQSRSGDAQLLLRTDHALYRAGDRINLQLFSTQTRGAVYVDVVKNGQTILTRDLDLEDGQAKLSLTATPEMSGTLDLSAYVFGPDAQPIGDHRLVFIQPASELKIETVADAPSFLPGADARIHFHVSDTRGRGVSAAIGVQVVDEAVFALAEKQPGFAKVFFYLEQEAMKPRYEVHSFSMDDVVATPGNVEGEQRDLAAGVLFSATEIVNPNRVDTEFGRTLPQTRFFDYQQRYRSVLGDQVRDLSTRLNAAYVQDPSDKDPVRLFSRLTNGDGSRPHDPWGTELRLEPIGWQRGAGTGYYQVHSAGPDRRFNTGDDLTVSVFIRSGSVPTGVGGHTIDLKLEQDRGPFNGLAQAVGSVTDATGAVVPGATVELRDLISGKVRHAVTNASGDFDLSSLPAGRYHVEISARGFETSALDLTLQPRDRATLSAALAVGSMMEAVTVDAAGAQMELAADTPAATGMAFMNGGFAGGGLLEGRAMNTVMKANAISTLAVAGRNTMSNDGDATPHIRSYFPEALYINPEILTDASGNAAITIPLADSITTWRMAMLASTESGELGSSTSALKVFQDFFVDLDLPVTLTQGDRVSIPVAVYNYSGQPGDVALTLQPDDWFSLVDDVPGKSVTVAADRVGASQFTLQANRIGKFKLTLSARMSGSARRQDVIVREIEVVPNGREQNVVFNGRLDATATHDIIFPADAIPDASKIFVRLYPGPLSQVVEGMDSILRMPGGCFEQTSSSTYPNVLALDYMKRTKKLTPEVHAKAEGYIANGYQRLLTFEVPGGGFSWFGQAPANKILTAYGLMEFADMAKVYDVDPRLIERTANWLAAQQQTDGSWKPDTSFINEGATNRYNSDVLRITSYIAWSLANTGYKGPAVEKARQFIASQLDDSSTRPDAYTLAVLANFAVDFSAGNREAARDFTNRILQLLLDARTESGDQVSWTAAETGVYSTGASAAIETTGLAAQALLKWGQAAPTVRKALNFLTSTKQADGNWGTTQATIMALRALLLASEASASDVRGTASITLNGKPVQTLALTPENNDLFQQFVLPNVDPSHPNIVAIGFSGTGGLAYQVLGRYFVPWHTPGTEVPVEALSIDIAYDRTKIAQNGIATATATIRNNLSKTANMVMVDLGIPPGFDLLSEDLQAYTEKNAGSPTGRLEKFSLTATQAILYFNALGPKQTLTLNFRLRAKYPIHAKTFQSRVYEYYDPAVSAVAPPAQFEVTER